MSHYPNAQFLKSANARSQFVPDTGIEVAVAGRSNAGKSSAINVIVNRRQFARTSKTPGRTQLVNFFELREDQRLVDLPGYGFARVSESMRRHWGELLAEYFESRQSLAGLILIVDIRRRLTDFDRRMIEFAESVAVLEVRKELGDRATVQQFSALKRQGEQEAREVLERFLAAGA
jgi:GTP-binding protein